MRILAVLAAVAALGLAACSQAEVDQAGEDAAAVTEEAADAVGEAADATGEAAAAAGDAVEGAVNDAANATAAATDDNPATNP